MKKTLLNRIPNEMPRDIQCFVSEANIYDSSCSPGAKVYFIDKGNGYYLKSQFPNSFGYRSAKEAYDVLTAEKGALQSKVLLHGDYCLPNIILKNWKLSGFIDVGNGGIGDRHIDIYWGIWSLWFNLKTNKYYDRFLDAYGRDKADESILKIVAAAEVFG